MLLVAASEALLLLLAIALGMLSGHRFWEDLDPRLGPLLAGAALSLPMAAAAVAMARGSGGRFARLREDFDYVIALFRDCTVFDLLLIGLLAGVGEEALFRGVLQPWFAQAVGDWVGLILVSILFGLCHAISRVYVVMATIMGLYLGLLYLATDNVVVPIMVHAVYDFLALLYGVKFHARTAN